MTSKGEQGHRGNVIRLFDEKERTEQGWARRNEALMHYLDRSGRRQCARVRALLEDWFSRYPQEHRRHLRGQMFSDSDSKQRSAWWELYLHESFVRAGCSVEVSSGTPDFLIESECGRFYVEATARFEDPTDIARERRENALLEELDATRCGYWRLAVQLLEVSDNSAPAVKLRSDIERWVAELEADANSPPDIQESDADSLQGEKAKHPNRVFSRDGWKLEVTAARGSRPMGHGSTAVVCVGPTEMKQVTNAEALRKALHTKLRACKQLNLDAPLVLAVLLSRRNGREDNIESALFGSETTMTSFDPQRMEMLDMREFRGLDGVWSPKTMNATASGILAGVDLDPIDLAVVAPTLWVNPFVQRSPMNVPVSLPWHHRWLDVGDALQCGREPSPASFFGLSRDWLGTDD